MDATAQATAKMSLGATGFPPPLTAATVPRSVRLIGFFLGRDWLEDREAAIIRACRAVEQRDAATGRAMLALVVGEPPREVNLFERQVWTAPMTVTADRLGAGDVIDVEDTTFTVARVELHRHVASIFTVEVPGYELRLRRLRPITVMGHVCTV
jgi:hypothetical protein